MSIQSEITRISGAKSDIADAIEAKGVIVPSSSKIDDYAELIYAIPFAGAIPIEDIWSFATEGWGVRAIMTNSEILAASNIGWGSIF